MGDHAKARIQPLNSIANTAIELLPCAAAAQLVLALAWGTLSDESPLAIPALGLAWSLFTAAGVAMWVRPSAAFGWSAAGRVVVGVASALLVGLSWVGSAVLTVVMPLTVLLPLGLLVWLWPRRTRGARNRVSLLIWVALNFVLLAAQAGWIPTVSPDPEGLLFLPTGQVWMVGAFVTPLLFGAKCARLTREDRPQ